MTSDSTAFDRPATSRARAILDTAITLFNRHGVAHVSTNKIANAAGISSGNLHYHYRSKSDVLLAAYRAVEEDLQSVMAMDEHEFTAERVLDIQLRVFRELWRYRFFFGSMEVMLNQSPALFERYATFQGWAIDSLTRALHRSVQSRHFRAIALPNTAERIAANTWMVWAGWIRWEMISHGAQGLPPHSDEVIVLRIAERHLSFQIPYYEEAFAMRLAALLADEIGRH